MRRILLAFVLLLAPAAVAEAENCTLSGTGNLTYTAPTTLAFSGTTTGCTLSLDDNLAITGTVAVPLNVGQAANPLTGGITVASGGSFTPAAGATVFSTGIVEYASGSSGTLNGTTMTVGAPRTITFPSATTILLDFAGCAKMNRLATTRCTFPGSTGSNTLWTLCNSASSCGSNTIHAATTNESATLLYFDWTKLTPPENLFIGSNGRAADTKPVYDPGLYLTVTSVDPTNNTVTVTLPDVGTNGAAYWYTVAEALSGTGLQNIVSGSNWTVSGAGVYTNNENKRRYEIQIDTADSPFDADHEFEGYLICRRLGGYCARIIKSETLSHDMNYTGGPAPTALDTTTCTGAGTCASVVVWNDPTGIVGVGDEMDVYYAKPTPDDTLVFVNPVHFVFTRTDANPGGSLYIDLGANVATTASPSTGVWVEGGWGGRDRAGGSVGTEQGSVDFANETLGINIDLWLVEKMDGCIRDAACRSDSIGTVLDGGITHIFSATGLSFGSDTIGVGLSNLYASRVTVRYPQVAYYEWNHAGSWTPSPAGIAPVERNGADRGVSIWSNDALRKIRIEGYGYGMFGAISGIIRNCKDGIWAQDMLFLHGRSGRPTSTTANRGDDTFEYEYAGANCDVDRMVTFGSTYSVPLMARSAHEGQTYYTSIVALGGLGRTSRAYPITGDTTRYKIHTSLAAQADTGVDQGLRYTRGWVKFANWVTDGKTTGINNAYGSWSDWYTETTSVPSSESCEDTTGFYVVGGYTGYGKLGDSKTASTGSCTSTDDVTWRDVYMTALSNQNNSQPIAGGTGLINLSKSQAPHSVTFDGWMISSKRDNATSLFDARGATPTSWVLPTLRYKNLSFVSGNASGNPTAFHALVTSSVPNISSFVATNVFWSQPNSTALQCYVGGNIACTTCADGAGGTHICSAAAGENELYAGTSKSLGTSGDYATGLGLTPMTWTTDEAGTDDVRNAAPRYAGIVVYDWPFAWATMDPVPGYRRSAPRNEYIPARLRARMGGAGGGGGWLPRAF